MSCCWIRKRRNREYIVAFPATLSEELSFELVVHEPLNIESNYVRVPLQEPKQGVAMDHRSVLPEGFQI